MMPKTKLLIIGALSGYIATELDKAFVEQVYNFPLGSVTFLIGIIAYGLFEYFEGKKKNGDK